MQSGAKEAGRQIAWHTALVRDGYALLSNLIPQGITAVAREVITRDLVDRFDPARQLEYEHRSYCPDLRASPEIMALLLNPPVRSLLDAVIGFDRLGYSPGQIAIRRTRKDERPTPPEAHIDGLATPYNGVVGPELSTFTVLVGVFLTDVLTDYSGNLTVWPGSHRALEAYFRQRGPAAMFEGMPAVTLGDPVQLICTAGDVVLCHYQLAHASVANMAAAVDRIAVYFRLWLTDIGDRRWRLLTHIWDGWKIGQ
jgi:hypothetical protein